MIKPVFVLVIFILPMVLASEVSHAQEAELGRVFYLPWNRRNRP